MYVCSCSWCGPSCFPHNRKMVAFLLLFTGMVSFQWPAGLKVAPKMFGLFASDVGGLAITNSTAQCVEIDESFYVCSSLAVSCVSILHVFCCSPVSFEWTCVFVSSAALAKQLLTMHPKPLSSSNYMYYVKHIATNLLPQLLLDKMLMACCTANAALQHRALLIVGLNWLLLVANSKRDGRCTTGWGTGAMAKGK